LLAGVISDYARLLAGRSLDRIPAFLRPLKPAELAELSQTVKAIHPVLFTADAKQVREWHHRQIPELTTLVRLQAASFHLDRLAELDPLDSDVKEQRAKVQARQIPSRARATPANLLDLSDVYTHSFDLTFDQEFADLPRGIQTLAGTQFDLRGLVRLEAGRFNGIGDARGFPIAAGKEHQSWPALPCVTLSTGHGGRGEGRRRGGALGGPLRRWFSARMATDLRQTLETRVGMHPRISKSPKRQAKP
jgi:hypothetical protein